MTEPATNVEDSPATNKGSLVGGHLLLQSAGAAAGPEAEVEADRRHEQAEPLPDDVLDQDDGIAAGQHIDPPAPRPFAYAADPAGCTVICSTGRSSTGR